MRRTAVPWLLLILWPGLWAQSPRRTYVGSDTCAGCHTDHSQWLGGSVHEKAALPSGAAKGQSGCESCHGPGSEHAESPSPKSIITFRLEPASQRSGQCLACHGLAQPNREFRRGGHATGKVACNDCHRGSSSEGFHRLRAAADTLRGAQPALCYRCHSARRADFALPSRHPVPEGHVKCSDCHQPHGGYNLRQLRSRGVEEVCGKCHEDKQGPFLFEHPVGRASGCLTCHRPHGGTNPKLLTRLEVRWLCLECHPNTPAFHDLGQARYRNCTVCHVRIHGSNLNRRLLE